MADQPERPSEVATKARDALENLPLPEQGTHHFLEQCRIIDGALDWLESELTARTAETDEQAAERPHCWHCQVVLVPEVLRCDRCPAPGYCGDDNCPEPGCIGESCVQPKCSQCAALEDVSASNCPKHRAEAQARGAADPIAALQGHIEHFGANEQTKAALRELERRARVERRLRQAIRETPPGKKFGLLFTADEADEDLWSGIERALNKPIQSASYKANAAGAPKESE